MKLKTILFIIFLLITSLLVSQNPPDTLWTKAFGGINNDNAYSVQQTSDAGFIVCGRTLSYGSGDEDAYVIKTNHLGEEEWFSTYGGNLGDWALSVQETSDFGFIITGMTESYGAGNNDVWLIKTDINGDTLWTRTYGGNSNDGARDVQQTTDSGYIIAGGTMSYGAGSNDFWLIKTDENGNEVWNQTFGGSESDRAYSVQQTSEGGYIVAGYTFSFGEGSCDFWLIKTDTLGNQEWEQTYGGINNDSARDVQQTSDGGYILTGNTSSYGAGSNDFLLIKTDVNGIEVWSQTFGGSEADEAYSVNQTSDGGYIVTGYTNSYGSGANDFWLIKTVENGNEEWNKCIGGSSGEYARCVQQTSDGGYILAGETYSYGEGGQDVWLVRVDSEIYANFSANPTFGYYPSLEVDFTDESGGSPINWSWDFQNDGIYDSFEQNPTCTYTQSGIYDVKLKISNETQVDSLIKYNYITVELVPPSPPSNMQIEISGNDALLTWAEVDTTIFGTPIVVDYYLVFGS